MATIGSLAVNIVARTSSLVRGVTRSRALIKSLALVAGISATTIVSAGAKMVDSYEGLNRSMTRSVAIMSDVSDTMRGEMTQAALEVSRTTQFAARQAGEAYYFLASAGMKAEESLRALPIVARFAQAGNFDLARATDLATDAQSAMGLKSKDLAENMRNLTHVTDVLVKANTLANASVEQFSSAMTNGAAAAAKAVGMSMEELLAVLAAFADQGVKDAEAGTAFQIVLRDLQTKAINNKEAFAAAGVAVFDANEEFRNMADIVADLEILLGGLSDEQKKATLLTLGFSDKSIKYVQALLGMSGAIREYNEGLNDAAGTSRDVAEKSLTDLQKAINSLRGAFEELSQSMAPIVKDLATFLDMISGGQVAGRKLEKGFGNVAQMIPQEQLDAAIEKLDKLDAMNLDPTTHRVGVGHRLEELGVLDNGHDWATGDRTQRMAVDTWEKTLRDEHARRAQEAQARRQSAADAGYGVGNSVALGFSTSGFMLQQGMSQQRIDALAAVQEQRKAAEAAEAEQKRLAGRADQFRDLVKTPAERMMDSIDEARELVKKGLLGQDTLDRLIAEQNADVSREADKLRKSVQTPLEAFREEIGHYQELFMQGEIDGDTAQRLIDRSGKRLSGGTTRPRFAQLQEISQSDQLFGDRGNEAGKDPMREAVATAKEQLTVLQDIRDGKGKGKSQGGFLGDVNVRMHDVV